MVFSSAIFLYFFLPSVFLLSRLVPSQKGKNFLLALFSIVFYAFGQLQYVPVFLCSILINYCSGLLLMKEAEEKRRKLFLSISVVLNLAILSVFKYTDFVIANLNSWFSLSLPFSGLDLPAVGISFFTFQGMSYTIDVYRDPKTGTKDFIKLLLYISFFPQLIAGPIVKYHDIAEQIDHRVCTAEETEYGIKRFIVGLAKKVILANAVGYIADQVFNVILPGDMHDWRVMWLGGICYTLQIYYDFSGYSDMAIGMGRMFGFRFRENFDHPYGSSSLREFWRKWHISLSSWFKEYLYIPLGGNRKGAVRKAINKLIVFFCTGIWHGANWTFVFWGLGHGILSSLEDLGILPIHKLEKSPVGKLFAKLYTLLAVMLLFVVFRASSIGEAFSFIGYMFTGASSAEGSYLLTTLLPPATVLMLLIAILMAGNLPARLHLEKLLDGESMKPMAHILCLGGFLVLYILCGMDLARGGFNPFIYFQF